jgi:stage II sporulation protein D
MPVSTRAQIWAVSTLRCLLRGLLASAVIGTSAVLTTLPAQADPAVATKSGSFTIRGAGWGHGWGMSQYGAYGAARKGLSWKQVLAFYYRGTQLSTMPSGTKIKVWVSSDNDNSLRVLPARGLTVRDTGRSSLRRANRCEVHLVANQPLRRWLPAELPDRQR